jgi:predicted nucleic acid-binding protein
MQAVCNTGPLTHLWQIQSWSIFSLFETVHVAEQVIAEIAAHADITILSQKVDLQIHLVSMAEIQPIAATIPAHLTLHLADLATLVLAHKIQPDLVLTDDLALRKAIEGYQLKPMGSVGLVLRAYKRGLLSAEALDQAIEGLFVHSTLYLSSQFKQYVKKLIATQ